MLLGLSLKNGRAWPARLSSSKSDGTRVIAAMNGIKLHPAGSHCPSDRSGRCSFTRSEGDRFQVRAEATTPLEAAGEGENSGLAVWVWHCDEAAKHNPLTGSRQKAAARNPEVAARTPEAAARPQSIYWFKIVIFFSTRRRAARIVHKMLRTE